MLAGFPDLALLTPFDPRSPALAAQDPDVAMGIWSGTLALGGGLVRLAWVGDAPLALVEQNGALTWATLADGKLVPLEVREAHAVEVDSSASTGKP